MQDIIDHEGGGCWLYEFLSENSNITPEYIDAHIIENEGEGSEEDDWDWNALSANKHLTIEFISKHIDKSWHWGILSGNPAITLSDIENTIHDARYRWHHKSLSSNPNITIEFVKKYPNGVNRKGWYWMVLSKNKGISITDIDANLDLPWVWKNVYINPNFTVEHAEKYKEKDEKHFYAMFSSNPNLTEEFVSKHINESWNWGAISRNRFGK